LQANENNGEESNGEQIVAKQMARQPGEHRNTRRLVYITPCQMLAARNEVQFITKKSVATI